MSEEAYSLVDSSGVFRPSLPDFYSGPPFVLRRSQQLLSAYYNAECGAVGLNLTETQLDALRVISLRAEPLGQAHLGTMLGLDRATMSSVIDGLVRRKLVRRIAGADRRSRNLMPLEAARELCELGAVCVSRSEAALFQRLPGPDVALLLDMLERVAKRNDAGAPLWDASLPDLQASGRRRGGRDSGAVAPLFREAHFLMRRCMQIVTAYVAESIAPLGLSSGLQLIVLYIVAACESVDQARIGRILYIDKSSVSLILSLLQSQGFIDRVSDPNDGRRRLASVTQTGMALLKIGVRRGQRVDDQMFERLPKDTKAQLTQTLARLVRLHGGFVD